jgi:hypothetical protein
MGRRLTPLVNHDLELPSFDPPDGLPTRAFCASIEQEIKTLIDRRTLGGTEKTVCGGSRREDAI